MLDPDRLNEIVAATAHLPNRQAWRKIRRMLRADGWHYLGFPLKQIWEARRRLLAEARTQARARSINGE